MSTLEPRATCPRCRRPLAECWCPHVTPIATRTRVVILQHPRERDVPIGTARMAELALVGCERHVGVRWSGTPALAHALGDPERPAALLYPGPGARDVLADPPATPITLIVVDGTWSQAQKLVHRTPELAALPRLAFTAPTPSEYQIRREPSPAHVSTLEALVHVLGALEGEPERFTSLLAPFRAMVAAQVAHATRRAVRVKGPRGPRPPKAQEPWLDAAIHARAEDLVCLVAEANAWPYTEAPRPPDELAQVLALRLATGEHFSAVLAPRALAPHTAGNLGLPEAELAAGLDANAFARAWAAFTRPTDLVVTWGARPRELLGAITPPPPSLLDLRERVRARLGGALGTPLDALGPLGLAPPAPLGPGRAGPRLAALVLVTGHLLAHAG